MTHFLINDKYFVPTELYFWHLYIAINILLRWGLLTKKNNLRIIKKLPLKQGNYITIP